MGSLYVIASVFLFLYSYTQVDLSLTLSRMSVFQTLEKTFQYVGWYQRPLATALFILLVVLFFSLYWAALRRKNLQIWKIIIPMAVILLFSYPAFSYDIFNYMFDAKTVLVYHKLPYSVIPLAFSGVEPWLSFMRWTHIPSVFSPFWILLTLPFYLLGFGYFLGILWSFKLLAVVAYLATSFFIYKILADLDREHAVRGVAVFALNPLVIFESLVSAHNDIVMMAFAMGSYYAYIHRKRLASFVVLSASIATKIMTVSLVPVFLAGWQRTWALGATLIGFVAFLLVTGREIQPWYMIWFLPWVALLPRAKRLTMISIGVSMGFLLRYAPYLYTGGYNPPVPAVEAWLVIIPTALAVGFLFGKKLL